MSGFRRLLRNTAATYLGSAVSFLVTLFLTPFVINHLGDALYGVWALILSVSGYLGVLDLGFGSALTKYVAGNTDDSLVVNELASTLLAVFMMLGLLAVAVAAAIASQFVGFFEIPLHQARATRISVVLMGISFCLGLVLRVANALAIGYQRHDLVNAAGIVTRSVTALLSILVLRLGWGLVGLAAATAFSTVANTLLLVWFLREGHVPIRFSPALCKRKHLRALLSYSIFIFLMTAFRRIEENSRAVLVGRLLGLEAVTVFSVGSKIGNLVLQFTVPAAVALFPAFAAISGPDQQDELKGLLVRGLRLSAFAGFPVAGIALVLVRPLLSAWVGTRFADHASIGVVLILLALVNQQLLAASSLLNGLGRLKLYTVLHLAACLVSVVGTLVFARRFGVIAVAASALAAWGAVLLILFPYVSHIVGISPLRLSRKALLRPLLLTSFVATLLRFVQARLPGHSLGHLGAKAGGAGVMYLILAWSAVLQEEERQAVVGAVCRFRKLVSIMWARILEGVGRP